MDKIPHIIHQTWKEANLLYPFNILADTWNKVGGIYIDVDFECLKNISPLLANKACVIGKEPYHHIDRFFKEMIFCNAFMASTPGNDFMKFVCNEIISYPSKGTVTQEEVLESTGPFILTDSFIKYKHKENIRILESDVLYPLTMTETRNVFGDSITDEMQEKINHAHAVRNF